MNIERKFEKKVLSLLLALAMVITMVPMFSVEAWADKPATAKVQYLDPTYSVPGVVTSGGVSWTTKTTTAAIIAVSKSAIVTWGALGTDSWYVVSGTGITLSKGVTVQGNVHLILANGCSLNVKKSIQVSSPSSLTIYAQSTGTSMGSLTATGEYGAGIGGGSKDNGSDITINGGAVTATGGNGGAGIGGGRNGNGSDITINGGNVTATGGGNSNGGAGIGGGNSGAGSNITINGGTVTATGGYGGAGIGGGQTGTGSAITINGGTVEANGGNKGAGIGGGNKGAGSGIIINGGNVTATGGGNNNGGAGIGGGYQGAGSAITINDGTVTAKGGKYAAGIGGGQTGAGSVITIKGGTVTATGGYGGAGIGGGRNGNGSDITINGGTVTATGGAGNTSVTTGAAIGCGGSCTTSATAIKVKENLILKADSTTPPATVIEHESDENIATKAGFAVQYVTIEPKPGVVKIGNTEYYSIQDAIDAVSAGQTIQLTTNVALDATITVAKGKDFTLDFNGYVLDGSKITDGSKASVIYNEGNLTIVDSNSNSSVHYYTVSSSGIWVWDDGNSANAKALSYYEENPSEITTGAVVAISGGAVTGGKGSVLLAPLYGGGIYNNGTLTMSAVTVIGNAISSNTNTAYGGSIYNSGKGNLTMIGVYVLGNKVYSDSKAVNGGGIYNEGTLNITGSTVAYNVAQSGTGITRCGGISNYRTLNITDSTVKGNVAQSDTGVVYGGGIYNNKNCTATISQSAITNNKVVSNEGGVYGGGICNNGTMSILDASLISSNVASSSSEELYPYGGGICNWGDSVAKGVLLISHSTVSNNTAKGVGPIGGIYNAGTLTLESSTVDKNTANGSGAIIAGGVLNDYSSSFVSLSGSTKIYDNTVSQASIKSNLVLFNSTSTPSALVAGALIYVTLLDEDAASTIGAISATGADFVNYFKADDAANMHVTASGSALYLASGASKTSQSISFAGITDGTYTTTYGAASFTTTVSGVQTSVRYESSNSTVAAIDASTGAVSIKGVGTTTITAVAAESDAYTSASAFYVLTVNKRPVTITAGSDSKVYDGTALTTAAFTTSGSLASGETLSVTIGGTQTNVGTSASIVSAYSIMNATTNVTDNYDVTTVSGILTVTSEDAIKVEITSIQAISKVYDGTTAASFTCVVSGIATGTDIKITSTAAFDTKDAGENKIVNITFALDPAYSSKYKLSTTAAVAYADITSKSATELTIEAIPTQTYTGKALTPSAVVKDGNVTLIEGTDYTVSYENNTAVGTASAIITGTGNYTGTKTVEFAIEESVYVDTTSEQAINVGNDNITATVKVSSQNDVKVKGLDSLLRSIFSSLASPTDIKVEISVSPAGISVKAEEKTDIEALAPAAPAGKEIKFDFFDINLKQYLGIESLATETNIHNTTDNAIEIVIPVDDSKTVTGVYRYHGKAESFVPGRDADGTYYVEAGKVHLFSKLFSTYAISYTEETPTYYYIPETYTVSVGSSDNGTVTVSPKSAEAGSTVTLTVTPDKGYTLETLTVTDKNGKEIELTAVTAGEKYTFKMPSANITVNASFKKLEVSCPFVDIVEDAYYYDAVLWAYETGVTKGADDTHFNPNGSTTRGEMITFLWRAAGSPVVNYAMPFEDVEADAYYTDAVRWAAANGVTNGVDATHFAPSQTISRAEEIAFLWKYAGKLTETAANPFADVDANAYYSDAVAWAYANKITNGTSATTFGPADDCLRGQVVSFLYNYFGK